MTKDPNLKQIIKRLSLQAVVVDEWKHITPRYGENNTAEIRKYLPGDPFLLYDYKCIMLIYEEGKSKKEAVAIADDMKPDDWYETWLDLKRTLDNTPLNSQEKD